jgi:hypothetical protein
MEFKTVLPSSTESVPETEPSHTKMHLNIILPSVPTGKNYVCIPHDFYIKLRV